MLTTARSIAPTAPTSASLLHPSSIVVPVFALPACLLCIAPLVVHSRARNLPASFLVGGYVILNFFNFLNAVTWPDNPPLQGYDGTGLCDIEVKLYVGIPAAVAGAIASIFRQLSQMVDTGRSIGTVGKTQRRLNHAFEHGTCLGVALYSMAVHYIIQPSRYELAPVEGCVPTMHRSWLSVVLMALPPLVLYSVAVVYCALTAFRLLKHRQEVSGLLSASKTTKSRYHRLFALAFLMLFGNLPLGIWTFTLNATFKMEPYTWYKVHPPLWPQIIERVRFDQMGPWDGSDRYLQIAGGYILFTFFGFGDETKKVYRSWLVGLGTLKAWKCLAKWWAARLAESRRTDPESFTTIQPRTVALEEDIDVELACIFQEVDAHPARLS